MEEKIEKKEMTFEEWNNINYDDSLEEITRYTYQEYDRRRDEYLEDKTIMHKD